MGIAAGAPQHWVLGTAIAAALFSAQELLIGAAAGARHHNRTARDLNAFERELICTRQTLTIHSLAELQTRYLDILSAG